MGFIKPEHLQDCSTIRSSTSTQIGHRKNMCKCFLLSDLEQFQDSLISLSLLASFLLILILFGKFWHQCVSKFEFVKTHHNFSFFICHACVKLRYECTSWKERNKTRPWNRRDQSACEPCLVVWSEWFYDRLSFSELLNSNSSSFGINACGWSFPNKWGYLTKAFRTWHLLSAADKNNSFLKQNHVERTFHRGRRNPSAISSTRAHSEARAQTLRWRQHLYTPIPIHHKYQDVAQQLSRVLPQK